MGLLGARNTAYKEMTRYFFFVFSQGKSRRHLSPITVERVVDNTGETRRSPYALGLAPGCAFFVQRDQLDAGTAARLLQRVSALGCQSLSNCSSASGDSLRCNMPR